MAAVGNPVYQGELVIPISQENYGWAEREWSANDPTKKFTVRRIGEAHELVIRLNLLNADELRTRSLQFQGRINATYIYKVPTITINFREAYEALPMVRRAALQALLSPEAQAQFHQAQATKYAQNYREIHHAYCQSYEALRAGIDVAADLPPAAPPRVRIPRLERGVQDLELELMPREGGEQVAAEGAAEVPGEAEGIPVRMSVFGAHSEVIKRREGLVENPQIRVNAQRETVDKIVEYMHTSEPFAIATDQEAFEIFTFAAEYQIQYLQDLTKPRAARYALDQSSPQHLETPESLERRLRDADPATLSRVHRAAIETLNEGARMVMLNPQFN